MTDRTEIDYLQRKALQERDKAAKAPDLSARRAHQRLADHYDERIAMMERIAS